MDDGEFYDDVTRMVELELAKIAKELKLPPDFVWVGNFVHGVVCDIYETTSVIDGGVLLSEDIRISFRRTFVYHMGGESSP